MVSFFVSSLFVPDAERAIVLARRGMFLTRTEIAVGDCLEKNKGKLVAPKGEGGNAMSMF